ncbi:MAG: NnrS family protein [Neisseriaceae bacterium]|nr:NnrS family protein [Neisseriaceae bacterium]
MNTFIPLNATPNVSTKPSLSVFFSIAFRPFYTVAVLYGAVAILMWGPLGFLGSNELPSFLWHAHEMIWGYTGAVIVGFFLTAVATWTGQKPLQGAPLIGLLVLWLLARIAIYLPNGTLYAGLFGSVFYLGATLALAKPIIASRNSRNFIAPLALGLFGLTHLWFHLSVFQKVSLPSLYALQTGLLMVAGIIGLIGMRIIPFFTSRALHTPTVNNPKSVILSALVIPMLMTLLMLAQFAPSVIAILGLVTMTINLIQLARWYQHGVATTPLLWILYVGYGATALGVGLLGVSYAYAPALLSSATHLIAVGGIGLLTLGMMARTALGHTGRAMVLPKPLLPAFWLMVAALIVRLLAGVWPEHTWLLSTSALCFALALLLYAYRYLPWLVSPRADGKAD